MSPSIPQGADGPINPPLSDRSAPGATDFDTSARRLRPRRWDLEIAAIANRQHGLVTLAQLERLGMDRRTAAARVRSGRLHRIHQGVFAVGHPCLSREATFLGAALACGSDAVLSHGSASTLWGFWEEKGSDIHVMASNRRGRSPQGIVAHRDGRLPPSDRTTYRGVPCTTVARTLLDLAAILPARYLRKALGEAEVMRLVDHQRLRDQIRRGRGRRGVARLRLLLDEIHPQTKRSRSELERMFLHVCLQTGLPQPEVNATLEVGDRRFKPDFLWRRERLILEADSRRFHDTDIAFVDDRRREQRLQVAGWRVSRCTWEQVEFEPAVLAETIRRLLTQA
ncbi:MAG TPA: type IV toxin-antitoxin system AbiEi family antitoxin domain-containing protein [Solirubrobacterales bacterium]|nr:type IV toxin-antitoxin system AbiEi family antitoxin domain-containing protein [Solirubrobacterales bacterium]